MATKYPVHRIFLTSGKVSHILESGVHVDGETSSLCGLWSDKWLGEDKQDAIKAKERPMCNNCTHIVMSRKITLVEPLTREQVLQTPLESLVKDRDGARWRRKSYGWKNENGLGSITSNSLNRYHSPIFLVEAAPEPAEEPVETLPDIPPAPIEDAAAEKSLLEEEIDRTLTEMRADLVRMRLIHGFTRREVADRIGVLPKHVRRFEEGISNPQVAFLRRYCLAIGVVLKFEVLHVVEES